MGPCPFRHGYGLFRRHRTAGLNQLQWGHALSGMDTVPAKRMVRYGSSGFNGAMPFQAWIQKKEENFAWLNSSFNGAMPFQAWIRILRWKGIAIRIELQWGHALSGMDTRDGAHLAARNGHGFNGAMPFQAWILWDNLWGLEAVHCFNGAMPFQAWIQVAIARSDGESDSFNGAMPFQAWIPLQKRRSVILVYHASMGPCPFRHGYLTVPLSSLQKNEASMGPCPFRHGYRHAVRLAVESKSASMGPCPFRHGYRGLASERTEVLWWLQWGHALSGMDTWGHISGVSKSQWASMGPCPFRHGYKRRWIEIEMLTDRFNGAMPFQAWIRGRPAPESQRDASFNGAMPFQAWIRWGGYRDARRYLHASMGPCPFRHGYLPFPN